jgi:hypothetical protein
MLSTIVQQIIEAGGFLSLPANQMKQAEDNIRLPFPDTIDRAIWHEYYQLLGISPLVSFWLIENDFRLVNGYPKAPFKFRYNSKGRLVITVQEEDRETSTNLSAYMFKKYAGIFSLRYPQKKISLNVHHIDGNIHNDSISNLGLMREITHSNYHNSKTHGMAPCIPFAHMMHNVYGYDWVICNDCVKINQTYTYLDVESDILPLLDQIEKGKYSLNRKRLLESA